MNRATSASTALDLHLGDFLALAPSLVPDASIDVAVTSPPYNLGIAYQSYRDNLPRERYLEWTDRWAAEVARALSPDGSLFVNVGGKPSAPWGAWEVAQVIARRLKLQNVIHWIKSISIDKRDVGDYPGIVQDVTVGHYKPVNSPRFLNDLHEYIFHFTPTGEVKLDRTAIGVPYQDQSNIARWSKAGDGLHCRGNVWFIPYPTIQFRAKDRPHPATFPPRLPEMCMRLHGVERIRRAMDPFLGLGSTALAARALGVAFVGFEIDEGYLQIARERLEPTARQAEMF
jgi:site-specific DNA-methyltransferase (adenine-specific)